MLCSYLMLCSSHYSKKLSGMSLPLIGKVHPVKVVQSLMSGFPTNLTWSFHWCYLTWCAKDRGFRREIASKSPWIRLLIGVALITSKEVGLILGVVACEIRL